MTETLQPTAIQKIGNELAIAWNDDTETYLPLEFLRKHCPCAACGGEPDVMGQIVRPKVEYSSKSFELVGWQAVGGYAVLPKWADGHATGIYSYKFLRNLATIGA
jgi:DUF971 family protein